ncbi:PMD domain-containing protein [Cephalotus follicularis]|uniref:PMD domain-containing protein n=1 Tax=Cephalotus follicularis TaxID=3775 RepID=A0A1Q3DIB4_CEPFO|nr:PMD domain-containing protein [Cephalotus follicularis]
MCCSIRVVGKCCSQIVPKCKTTHSALPKRPSFNSWILYFFKDVDKNNRSYEGEGFKTDMQLIAFLVMWFSRYIFRRNPRDGVSWRVFPLALKLAKRTSFGLAHDFLGRFYERLDFYKTYFGCCKN